jgi:hypothetical protein
MPDLEYIEMFGYEDHDDRINALEKELAELRESLKKVFAITAVIWREKYGSYEEGTR